MGHWIRRIAAFFRRLFGNAPEITASQSATTPQKAADTPVPVPLPPPQPMPVVGDPPQYRKRDSLMTYQERRFYRYVLLRVVDDRYRIFSKVRLGDLVWMIREPTDPQFHIGETWSKHIDFVVCDRQSLEPLVAIELDDSSHEQYDRRASDAVKDRVCADAELALIRVKVEKDYSIDTIGVQIHTLIKEAKLTVTDNDATTEDSD